MRYELIQKRHPLTFLWELGKNKTQLTLLIVFDIQVEFLNELSATKFWSSELLSEFSVIIYWTECCWNFRRKSVPWIVCVGISAECGLWWHWFVVPIMHNRVAFPLAKNCIDFQNQISVISFWPSIQSEAEESNAAPISNF